MKKKTNTRDSVAHNTGIIVMESAFNGKRMLFLL